MEQKKKDIKPISYRPSAEVREFWKVTQLKATAQFRECLISLWQE